MQKLEDQVEIENYCFHPLFERLRPQNGNRDYWFSYTIADNGVSKTIAQNLDILLSRHLGRPEPEFEGDEEQR